MVSIKRKQGSVLCKLIKRFETEVLTRAQANSQIMRSSDFTKIPNAFWSMEDLAIKFVFIRWSVLWSPSLTVVVARQQYGRRHSLAQESRTHSSSLEHRSLITAFACRSLLSLEDESVLESDHTVVSECLESNNNEEL